MFLKFKAIILDPDNFSITYAHNLAPKDPTSYYFHLKIQLPILQMIVKLTSDQSVIRPNWYHSNNIFLKSS